MHISFLVLNAFAVGGTIRTTLTMAAALAARGHDVEVVSVLRHRAEPELPVDPRVRLRVLVDNSPEVAAARWSRRTPAGLAQAVAHDALRLCPSWLAHPQDARYPLFSARTDLGLIRYLRSRSSGVVVGTRPALNLILARHARAGVVTVGQEHLHLTSRRERLREQYVRRYPGLDALVTLTQTDATAYRDLLGDRVRIEAIPNAVPEVGSARAQHLPGNATVVSAGRLTRQKGFDRLIRAFARVHRSHPDWTLDIFGRGPDEPALRAQIDAADLSSVVRLRGFTDTPYRHFAQSSIYVMSSRYEGFPLVLLEAMGVGLPLVAFDCPTGPADLITDGTNGLLVPNGNVKALAAALNRLIEDAPLRRQMGAAGLATVAEYRPDRIAARWEQLFADLEAAKSRQSGRAPAASRPRWAPRLRWPGRRAARAAGTHSYCG
jgi:glycosyltransferase involved in cell wall biosynthesis